MTELNKPLLEEVRRHCLEIDRCNQRGGRMLSVIDLLEAETLSLELAGVLLALIRSGASFLVGAVPGGAGKTTVMGALLNFVPPDLPLRPADSIATLRQALAAEQKACWICHEIGSGPYYAYLWGEALRLYFQLAEHGHILATNLHADTLQEAYEQICIVNRVPESLFRKVRVQLFLKLEGTWPVRRRINTLWISDGIGPHRQVFELARGWTVPVEAIVPAQALNSAERILHRLIAAKVRTIDEVRFHLLSDPEFVNFPA